MIDKSINKGINMSPRTAQANQQVRDERQEQILKAALRVFGRQGFAAAKISDIASEAGVSYGLVDHYFGKKEEIYTVVVARAYAGALGLLEDGLGRPGTPWERLQYVCETMLAGIKESPEYVLLVHQASTDQVITDESKALFSSYAKRITDLQVELICQGQAAGQVADGDPHELALALTAAIQGLAILWLYASDREDLQSHFPDSELVMRILRA
jgi:AcrR family transcriptional regulator